jgi:hypothetical protein
MHDRQCRHARWSAAQSLKAEGFLAIAGVYR